MTGEVFTLMGEVKAKTICQDSDEQLDVVEQLDGQHIKFYYDAKTIDRLLSEEVYYPDEIKRRVKQILVSQKRKYRYLFTESK